MLVIWALFVVFVLVVMAARFVRRPLSGIQAVVFGVVLFTVRAGGVWLGRAILDNTGGVLRFPAYAMVMLGWPEIIVPALLGWTRTMDHSVIMGTMLLGATSVTIPLLIYIAGRLRRRERQDGDFVTRAE